MKSPILKAIIGLACVYVFLKFMLPLFTAPIPSTLIFLYLSLTLSGILLFQTMSGGSLDAFIGPIHCFLAGSDGQAGPAKMARLLVLVVFPLLVGWQTYTKLAPSDLPPAENRTIHPAPPGEFVGLSNPVPKTETNIQIGKGFYFSNCLPCHGAHFDGNGPASVGFNPPPANFSDSGTIAQLQESYLFWRIKKGGVGLPVEGMPWKSAMPRWELELSDDMIWKIIMGEYDGAHQSPRTWEEEEE